MKILSYTYCKSECELFVYFKNVVGLKTFKLITLSEFNAYKKLFDNKLGKSLKLYNQRTEIVEHVILTINKNIRFKWLDDRQILLKKVQSSTMAKLILDTLKAIDFNNHLKIEPSVFDDNPQAILELRDRFDKYANLLNNFPIECRLDDRRDVSAFKLLSLMFEDIINIVDFKNIYNSIGYNVLPLSIPLKKVTNFDDNTIKKLIYHGIMYHPIQDYLVLVY